MTVEKTSNKVQHTTDGVQTDFPYNFLIQEAEDLTVYFDDVEEATGFTITGLGDPVGGLVIFATAPIAGITTLTLLREIAIKQLTDYTVYGAFPPERVEADYDKGILIDQQFDEKLGRALLAPVSEVGAFDYSLPSPIPGYAYVVNSANDALEMTEYPLDDAVNRSETAEANSLASSINSANCASEASDSEVAALISQNAAATSASNAATSETNAATSATEAAASAASIVGDKDAAAASAAAALVSENNASGSATTAVAAATSASGSATAAASSASAASASETNAGNSETAASGSASAASTSETNAASSASAASGSASAASTSEGNASTSAAAALVSQNAAAGSATAAELETWEAEAERMTADSYATEAEDVFVKAYASDGDGTFTAADTTEYSALHWAAKAATVPAITPIHNTTLERDAEDAHPMSSITGLDAILQDLSGQSKLSIDKIIASVSAVDVKLYDTRNDTDFGAWRDRCEDLSWYGEALNTSTRGKTRKFPAVALIVAEAGKVTIYDATDDVVPMWMVFTVNTMNMVWGVDTLCITMLNGTLSSGASHMLNLVHFLKDSAQEIDSATSYVYKGNIAERNDGKDILATGGEVIVNTVMNDVAMTVESNAPIDPATGLQRPTIVVFTDGGISVIAKDGTNVWDGDLAVPIFSGIIDGGRVLSTRDNYDSRIYVSVDISTIAADGWAVYDTLYSEVTIPALLNDSGYGVLASGMLRGGNLGLNHLKENPTTPAEGMVAYTTYSWASGWLVGDIKGAWLANSKTLDRSVNAKPLVENGTVTETAVATNAELMAYSGFSASNYFEQAYNADLDFGTGDFYIVGWYNTDSAGYPTFLQRRKGDNTGEQITVGLWAGKLGVHTNDSVAASVNIDDTLDTNTGSWQLATAVRRGDVLYLYAGVRLAGSVALTGSFLANDQVTRFGDLVSTGGQNVGSQTLWRMGKGAPSAEQIEMIYNDEKRLFTEGAKCTLAGTSDAVLALDHDSYSGQSEVLTSYGKSTFDGLLMIAQEATTVGTPTCVSAVNGSVAMGGTTAARLLSYAISAETYQYLEGYRDVGDGSTTQFIVPERRQPKQVFNAGLLVWEGASDEYEVSYVEPDYYVDFAVAPSNGDDVIIYGVR